ncbi:hypothetical protein TNCV_1244281 [Trichonephila clavipes]|nr:hypothetical protein TNCV_1244281 [Trichonephila clavipes]
MTTELASPSPNSRVSLLVKLSDRDWLVTSSSPELLKTRLVGERCTLNLSRAQTSSRWCDVVVSRRMPAQHFILTDSVIPMAIFYCEEKTKLTPPHTHRETAKTLLTRARTINLELRTDDRSAASSAAPILRCTMSKLNIEMAAIFAYCASVNKK